MRNKTCCFTGHRPEKLSVNTEFVKEQLKKAIKGAIADGYKIFISGMARGVDIWAAELVLEERKKNNCIKLFCASPYRDMEKNWENDYKTRYQDIIKNADMVEYVCRHYSKQCFQMRNTYMVERCSRLIAVYDGQKGGTHNTIKYAEKSGLKIINILE